MERLRWETIDYAMSGEPHLKSFVEYSGLDGINAVIVTNAKRSLGSFSIVCRAIRVK